MSDRDATKEWPSKELDIVDYDGFNPRRVTVNNSLNILPAWRPNGRALADVSDRKGSPARLPCEDLRGPERREPERREERQPGVLPTFSPDGKSLAFASNRSGSMDVSGLERRRCAAAPAHHDGGEGHGALLQPDEPGDRFTSDRTGTPQLWLMDGEGLNLRRLTVGSGNWNDGCAWNPSRQYSEIAYTARLEAGGFDIAIIDLATRQVRQITQGRGRANIPLRAQRTPRCSRASATGAGARRSPTATAAQWRPWPRGW